MNMLSYVRSLLGVCVFRFCYVRSHSLFFFFFVYFFMIGAKNKIIHTYFSVCVCLVFMNEVIHFFFFSLLVSVLL